jgi:ABC-type transporter Mla maintaining outer membrane lipid asymmetry ATPase subunit MlaF
MLRDGSIIFDGFDEEIRQSQDEYVQKFLAG